MGFIFSFFKSTPRNLPDHDIANNFASLTSTPWHHSHNCTECLSKIGHNEFMTRICLSCGTDRINIMQSGAAYRKIVRNGKWVAHQRYKGADYIQDEGGVWVKEPPPLPPWG